MFQDNMSDNFNITVSNQPDVFNVNLVNTPDVFQVVIAEKGLDGKPGENGVDGNSPDLSNYLSLSGGTLTGGLTGTSATFQSISAASYQGLVIPNPDLSNYLPLSGGTITGGLTGTSATFNSISAASYLGLPTQADIDNYLPLSGGNLTGPLSSNSTAIFYNLSESYPTLLKLDQTTPQTTVGTFSFPSLNVGSGLTKLNADGSGSFANELITWDVAGNLITNSVRTPTINGGTAANDDITIQGTSHATRTTSYVNLQPNGGNVGIGNTNPTAFNKLAVTQNITALSGFNNNVQSIYGSTTLALGSNEGTYGQRGALYQVEKKGAGNLTSNFGLNGAQFSIVNSGTGTIAYCAAFSAIVQNLAAGEMGRAYGVYIFSPTATAQNFISYSYGLYLNAQKVTGVTLGYGIYQLGTSDINYFEGKNGFGTNAPSARLHIAAGTASSGTAPIKLTSGTLLSIPEAGAVEYLTNDIYFTDTTPKRFPLVRSIYGSFYVEDGTQATTLTNQNAYYPIAAGFTGGSENGCTFQNAKEIKILVAGKYKVDWSLSISSNNGDVTIGGIILAGASGTTSQIQTEGVTRTKENGVEYNISGTGIVTCAVNDLIRLGLENETSAGVIVTTSHGNLTIMRLDA